MNLKNILKLCLCAYLLLSAAVYADSINMEKVAISYCETFDPSSWESLGEKTSIYEIYTHIIKNQDSVVTNQKFKAAIAQADNTSFSTLHASLKKNVERLLGHPWKCENFNAFFMPTQTVIRLSLAGIEKKLINPGGKDVVVVAITHNDKITINNAVLISTDASSIQEGIKSVVNNRKLPGLNFVLYSDAESNGALFSRVLYAMTRLGIKNIDLIDYH